MSRCHWYSCPHIVLIEFYSMLNLTFWASTIERLSGSTSNWRRSPDILPCLFLCWILAAPLIAYFLVDWRAHTCRVACIIGPSIMDSNPPLIHQPKHRFTFLIEYVSWHYEAILDCMTFDLQSSRCLRLLRNHNFTSCGASASRLMHLSLGSAQTIFAIIDCNHSLLMNFNT